MAASGELVEKITMSVASPRPEVASNSAPRRVVDSSQNDALVALQQESQKIKDMLDKSGNVGTIEDQTRILRHLESAIRSSESNETSQSGLVRDENGNPVSNRFGLVGRSDDAQSLAEMLEKLDEMASSATGGAFRPAGHLGLDSAVVRKPVKKAVKSPSQALTLNTAGLSPTNLVDATSPTHVSDPYLSVPAPKTSDYASSATLEYFSERLRIAASSSKSINGVMFLSEAGKENNSNKTSVTLEVRNGSHVSDEQAQPYSAGFSKGYSSGFEQARQLLFSQAFNARKHADDVGAVNSGGYKSGGYNSRISQGSIDPPSQGVLTSKANLNDAPLYFKQDKTHYNSSKADDVAAGSFKKWMSAAGKKKSIEEILNSDDVDESPATHKSGDHFDSIFHNEDGFDVDEEEDVDDVGANKPQAPAVGKRLWRAVGTATVKTSGGEAKLLLSLQVLIDMIQSNNFQLLDVFNECFSPENFLDIADMYLVACSTSTRTIVTLIDSCIKKEIKLHGHNGAQLQSGSLFESFIVSYCRRIGKQWLTGILVPIIADMESVQNEEPMEVNLAKFKEENIQHEEMEYVTIGLNEMYAKSCENLTSRCTEIRDTVLRAFEKGGMLTTSKSGMNHLRMLWRIVKTVRTRSDKAFLNSGSQVVSHLVMNHLVGKSLLNPKTLVCDTFDGVVSPVVAKRLTDIVRFLHVGVTGVIPRTTLDVAGFARFLTETNFICRKFFERFPKDLITNWTWVESNNTVSSTDAVESMFAYFVEEKEHLLNYLSTPGISNEIHDEVDAFVSKLDVIKEAWGDEAPRGGKLLRGKLGLDSIAQAALAQEQMGGSGSLEFAHHVVDVRQSPSSEKSVKISGGCFSFLSCNKNKDKDIQNNNADPSHNMV